MGFCRVNRSFPDSLGKESSHRGGSTCKCPNSVGLRTSNGNGTGDPNGTYGEGAGETEDPGQNTRDLVKSESKGHDSISSNKQDAQGQGTSS